MAVVRKKTGAFNAEHPFGKPEQRNQVKTFLIAGFIIIGLCFIIWMIATAPAERSLKCSGPSSLIGFGSCELAE